MFHNGILIFSILVKKNINKRIHCICFLSNFIILNVTGCENWSSDWTLRSRAFGPKISFIYLFSTDYQKPPKNTFSGFAIHFPKRFHAYQLYYQYTSNEIVLDFTEILSKLWSWNVKHIVKGETSFKLYLQIVTNVINTARVKMVGGFLTITDDSTFRYDTAYTKFLLSQINDLTDEIIIYPWYISSQGTKRWFEEFCHFSTQTPWSDIVGQCWRQC